jgi:Ca2+-binding EF-hand superfamily protein
MLTKLKVALALTAGLLGVGATVAAAQGSGGGDRGAIMKKYDTNGDGVLSDAEKAQMRADFQAKRAAMKQKMLQKYDLNHDGKLDAAERKLMREDQLEARFKKLDKNGDGMVSFEEFKAGNMARHGGHHRHHRHGLKPGAAPTAPSSLPPGTTPS